MRCAEGDEGGQRQWQWRGKIAEPRAGRLLVRRCVIPIVVSVWPKWTWY